MDKWEELKETLQEIHDGNLANTDIERITRFLLNLMNVLEKR